MRISSDPASRRFIGQSERLLLRNWRDCPVFLAWGQQIEADRVALRSAQAASRAAWAADRLSWEG